MAIEEGSLMLKDFFKFNMRTWVKHHVAVKVQNHLMFIPYLLDSIFKVKTISRVHHLKSRFRCKWCSLNNLYQIMPIPDLLYLNYIFYNKKNETKTNYICMFKLTFNGNFHLFNKADILSFVNKPNLWEIYSETCGNCLLKKRCL